MNISDKNHIVCLYFRRNQQVTCCGRGEGLWSDEEQTAALGGGRASVLQV